jgi:hypothetical protein
MESLEHPIAHEETPIEDADSRLLGGEVSAVDKNSRVVGLHALHGGSITGKRTFFPNDWLPYMATMGDVGSVRLGVLCSMWINTPTLNA